MSKPEPLIDDELEEMMDLFRIRRNQDATREERQRFNELYRRWQETKEPTK